MFFKPSPPLTVTKLVAEIVTSVVAFCRMLSTFKDPDTAIVAAVKEILLPTALKDMFDAPPATKLTAPAATKLTAPRELIEIREAALVERLSLLVELMLTRPLELKAMELLTDAVDSLIPGEDPDADKDIVPFADVRTAPILSKVMSPDVFRVRSTIP